MDTLGFSLDTSSSACFCRDRSSEDDHSANFQSSYRPNCRLSSVENSVEIDNWDVRLGPTHNLITSSNTVLTVDCDKCSVNRISFELNGNYQHIRRPARHRASTTVSDKSHLLYPTGHVSNGFSELSRQTNAEQVNEAGPDTQTSSVEHSNKRFVGNTAGSDRNLDRILPCCLAKSARLVQWPHGSSWHCGLLQSPIRTEICISVSHIGTGPSMMNRKSTHEKNRSASKNAFIIDQLTANNAGTNESHQRMPSTATSSSIYSNETCNAKMCFTNASNCDRNISHGQSNKSHRDMSVPDSKADPCRPRQTNYRTDMLDSINVTNCANNSYKVFNTDYHDETEQVDYHQTSGEQRQMRLPLIIKPATKQHYANQVYITGGIDRLPCTPYFTCRATKPSYEQILDCITCNDVRQLEKFVLDGFGNQVYSWRNANIDTSNEMRHFMDHIPDYQCKIEGVHGAIASGESVHSVVRLIGKHVELLLSRDQLGATPLHKAVLYQQADLVRSIVKLLPITLQTCDNHGRTPLHFAALLPDHGQIYRVLVDAGAMTTATDMFFRRPEDYLQNRQPIGLFPVPVIGKRAENTAHSSGPSIILNYDVNFGQPIDPLGHFWNETDENFNLESCYDRWWQHDSQLNLVQPISPANRFTLPSLHSTGSHSKSAHLHIPSLTKSTDTKQVASSVPNTSAKMATLALNRFNLKELIKQGNLSSLEDIVLQGNGDRLLGESSAAPLVQEFLDNLPNYLDQINELHKAAARGSLREFQALLDRSSLVSSRDPLGATPLHKAVLYGHFDLAEYIATNYGATSLDARDNDGRTALHYAAGLSDDRGLYQMLLKYGAKSTIIDQAKKEAYLPLCHGIVTIRARTTTPVQSLPNGVALTVSVLTDLDLDVDAELSSNDGSVISNASTIVKRSIGQSATLNPPQRIEVNSANLRRWIEENNIEMLEGAVIEGHGERIREKASGVLKDLDNVGSQVYIEETVPQIMNRIQHIHAAVSLGDLTSLQEGLEKKKDYILSKDHLGMTPLHKATIMGHVDVVQYILEKFPETVNARDREGRTALHYSTATTNRNGNKIYKMLIRAGADPRVRDLHGKTSDYYRVHLLSIPNEALRAPNKSKTSAYPSKASQQKAIGGLLGDTKSRRITQPAVREKINSALHSGNVAQLQELIFDGYGQELLGRTSFGEEARRLLKNIPNSLEAIRELQEADINGDQDTVCKVLAENGQFARARDSNSFTLMHLAVVGGHLHMVNYFLDNYPNLINLKDNMNRTALHLAALTGNTDIYRRLIEVGLDARSMDQKGKTAEYYLRNNPAITSTELQELLALSNPNVLQGNSRLSKMSKASSKQNLAMTETTVPVTNGGLSGSSLKISSKPVRLPALPRPSGKSSDSKSSPPGQVEDETIQSAVNGQMKEDMAEENKSEILHTEEEPMPNGQLKDEQNQVEQLEQTQPNAEQSEQNGELENGQETFAKDSAIQPASGLLTEQNADSQDATINGEAGLNNGQTESHSPKERVIIYSRGNEGNESVWRQFGDSQDASSAQTVQEEAPKADEAINQANLIADQNANEEATVEKDVINESNEASAYDSTQAELTQLSQANEANVDEGSGDGILAQQTDDVQVQGQTALLNDNIEEQTNLVNGHQEIGDTENKVDSESVNDKLGDDKADNRVNDQITEETSERVTWSRGNLADDVLSNGTDLKESELSKTFKGTIAKESDLVNKANIGPIDHGDMQVVNGGDAPPEDEVLTKKRNWSAESTKRTRSDPQMDWEDRKSSGNIRYVINPSSGSADSALPKLSKNTEKSIRTEKKIPSNPAINKEQMDQVVNNVKAEKGPWPETIVEEMSEKTDDNSNEDKLEQIIETVTEEESTPRVNRNSDRLNELIKHWLEEGDLLRLEHVVIAGQGDRLLSVNSDDKQVADFLNLVPAYMEKIKNVHIAVSHGNFEEVKKILTRKRFALCRDQFGASPLHLAVLHGHVDILIYIITQFPETIDGPDNDGRTPLHYAAVLPDKQIYQILDTANANKEQKDRFGFSPREYLTNGKLSIRDLLIKYSKDVPNVKQADLWERPPTSEIISQLTPDSGSVPSTANDDSNKPEREDISESIGQDKSLPNGDTSQGGKTVQILQIEPRQRYSVEVEEDSFEQNSELVNGEVKNETVKPETEEISLDAIDKGNKSEPQPEKKTEENKSEEKSEAQVEKEKGVINSVQETSSLAQRNRIKRMQTFDRTDSMASKRQSSINKNDASPADDKTFETMSDEFSRSLRNEKIRLQKSIDRQLSSTDMIKPNHNGSVIDSIQDASRPVANARIVNGLSAAGYDLTQIKDEHGRTVLHLAAAKDQKRTTFYKMLQQANYLVPERDSKYRTIRDVAVLNGIKNNLQVIDQFILDCFIKEQTDYVRMLMLEGYNNLLSVVDSEGNDVIAILKKNNINSMEKVIHQLAQLQKNRDELHTFIRHGYIEGVTNLVETDSELVIAKSDRGRTSLHLAVLFGNQDIIEGLINANYKCVNVPDNLGRTPLHYAMAMSKMEEIGRILIHCGANKTVRDVRMRTPTYYFVYKQEIRDIKREEQNLTI